MVLIWMIYSLSVATVGTGAMTSYSTTGFAAPQETTSSPLSSSGLAGFTRDATDESGGRRLADRNIR